MAILFLKAKISGGAAADLFNAPVMVQGHVRPDTGTYVAPYASHRRKGRPDPAPAQRPAQADLFTAPPPAPPAPEPGPAPAPQAPAGFDRAAWWNSDLTAYARVQVGNIASVPTNRGKTLWRHLSEAARSKIMAAYDRLPAHFRAGWQPPAAAPEPTPEPAAPKAPADYLAAMLPEDREAVERAAREAMSPDWQHFETKRARVLVATLRAIRERSAVPPEMEKQAAAAIVASLPAEPPSEAPAPVATAEQPASNEPANETATPVEQPLPDLAAEVPPEPAQVAPVAYQPPAPPERGEARRPVQWGHWEGVSAKRRVDANRAAEKVLRDKRDEDVTQADVDALGQYTGWGGCGDSANEYYTPRRVARAMWGALRNLGFQGGDVLEPSAGTGAFQQEAPKDARITAIELSTDAARINRILHAPAGDEVVSSSLEEWAGLDQRKFAAVIGNPPFGPRGAFRERDLARGKSAIGRAEWYFIDTALDKAQDGGLVALIVPNGVLDNASARDMRARMLAKAQLVTAWRLPSSAFAQSHTSVTTDVLILRKRPQPIASALAALSPMQQAMLPHWREDVVAGTYMTEGPGQEHILGRMEPGWRAQAGMGNDITVTGSMTGVDEAIADWQPPPEAMADDSPTLAAILDAAGDRRDAVEQASRREPYPRLREGMTRVDNGILYVLRGHRWHRAEAPEPEEVAAARKVGVLLERVMSGKADDMELTRQRLIESLDDFTAKYGNPARSRALADWTSSPQLPTGGKDAAEHMAMVAAEARRVAFLLGAVRADGSYSDLVTGRTAGPDKADLSTIATHLAERDGEFTPETLAREGGVPLEDARMMLDAHQGFARIPGTDQWTSLDHYLTGNLWPAYDAALKAAGDPDTDPTDRERFQRQADAIMATIGPADLADVQNIRLDSPFIPLEAIAAWKESTDHYRWVAEEYDGVFSVRRDSDYNSLNDDLLERMLMRRGVREDQAELVEAKHASFRDWLLSDPDWKARTEERYNRTFRGYVPRNYSDAPIDVPGLNPDFGVHGFQWKGVRWALERGKGIIAADVGVGKTPRALILNQLLRSTGRAKKPVIVVPKSLLANWLDMTKQMFPDAKVLTIGETIGEDDEGNPKATAQDEADRRAKIADLAQNDYDFTLMTLPAWNLLNIEDERRERYEADEFFNRRAEALEGKSSKKQRAAKEAQKSKDEGQRFRNKGEQVLTLEQTGIDAVFLDEGHSMKNLIAPESGPFKAIKFLGAPNKPAKQATATYQKFRYIREKNGGNNLFMLTATPTKNSPMELYSMLQHVAPEVWEEAGIRNGDDFISRFVETGPELVLGPNGAFDEKNVVKGFTSLEEIRQIARRFIDRTTAAEVGLKLPEAKMLEHRVDADEAQRAAYDALVPMLEDAIKEKGKEGVHPFTVMSDMQKAATDMRIYQPEGNHPPSPKLREVARIAAENRKDGGQIIFSDYVGAHAMIRDLLIAQGVDPKRIGIINADAAKSSTARQALGAKFNRGELDILIGNTATMGEGLNLQKRTADIHHVDTPWEPASIIQRNGRGLRQGNAKGEIRLHTYLTGGTFDGARWQSMMAKKDWQTAFWGGANEAENLNKDGRGSLSRLDMLIFASRDPEAAREQFASELALAKDRHAAAKQAAAMTTWGKYREAQAQLRAMQAKRPRYGDKAAPPAAEQKLADRVAAFKATLEASADFPWKDALDMADVLIDTRTGRLWRPGDEVAIPPGHRLASYSGGESEWLVRAVDEASRKVYMVPAGRIGDGKDMPAGLPMAISDMRDGISPTKIDREAARKRAEARDAEIAAAAEAAARRATEAKENAEKAQHQRMVAAFIAGDTPASGFKPSVLHAMGEDGLREHGPILRQRMREAVTTSKVHIPAFVTTTPDGRIMVRASYERDKIGPDEEFALPDAATLDKLTAAAARQHRDVKLNRYYAPTSGRNRGGYKPAPRGGVQVAWGQYDRKAPAVEAIEALYPESVARAARAEIRRKADAEVASHVREAPNFMAALSRAGGALSAEPTAYGDGQPYNGYSPNHLGRETARALLAAAETHGWAGKTWNTAFPGYSAIKAALQDDGRAINMTEMQSLISEGANPITRGSGTVADVIRSAFPHAFAGDAQEKAA